MSELEMEYNKMIEESFALKSDAEDIKHQIDMHLTHREEEGIPIDKVWMHKAKYAMTKKKSQANELQRKAGVMKRHLNIKKSKELSSIFVDCAKLKLDSELFLEIMGMAQDLYEDERSLQ